MPITPNINPTTVQYEDTIPMVAGRKVKVTLSGEGAQDTPVEYTIPEGFNSAEVYLYVRVSLQADVVNGG